MLSITSAKLSGNPAGSGWVQIHDFVGSENSSEKGDLYLIISVETESDVEGLSVGRDIATHIYKNYFDNAHTEMFSALHTSVSGAVKEFGQQFVALEIAAASFSGTTLYAVVSGGGGAILYRDGMIARILTGSEGVSSASGYPKEGDVLILTTSEFSRSYSEGILRAALEGADVERAIEQLAPSVHASDKSYRIGALFLGTSKTAEVVVTKELPEEVPASFTENNAVKVDENYPLPVDDGIRVTPGQPGLSLREKAIVMLDNLITKLPSRRLYIRNSIDTLEVTKKRKTALTAGLVLLMILLVSIGFGIKERNQRVKVAQYEPRLLAAQKSIDEAVGLVNVDAERSRLLFIEGKKTVDQLINEGVADERLMSLQALINEKTGIVLGEFRDNPELYVDLSLVAEGFKGTDMASSGTEFVILDTSSRKIVKVDAETKKSLPIAGPDKTKSASKISLYSGRVFILGDEGVSEIDGSENIIEKSWGDALIYSYTANMYVLDKTDSKIYRYAGVSDGFGSRTEWLAEGSEVSLGDIVSWTIDGSVWMVAKDGGIYKFTQGRQDFVKKILLEPEITDPTVIYTNEEGEFVYLLEKTKGRIIVLDKDANFIAQYQSDSFKSGVDMVVFEDLNLILVLVEEGELLSLPVKHKK
jgi:hypothetical protein